MWLTTIEKSDCIFLSTSLTSVAVINYTDTNSKEEGKAVFRRCFQTTKLVLKKQKEVSTCNLRGTLPSCLVRSSQDHAARARVLAGDIVLCSWARHFTLTVPLFTQVYMGTGKLTAGGGGGNPAMDQ